jgi:hypothetical protein
LVEKALNTSSGLVRSDATSAIQRVALNRRGTQVVFDTLETKLFEITWNIGGGAVNPVQNIVSSLTSSLSSQDELDRVKEINLITKLILSCMQILYRNYTGIIGITKL